jgi:hypothetical protein
MTDGKLLLHLPLDERFGNVVRDATSNRRNATIEGTAEIVDDADFGDSLKLEHNARLNLPPIPSSELVDGLTFEMWLKPVEAGPALRFGDNVLVLFASPRHLALNHVVSAPLMFAGSPPFHVVISIAPNGELVPLSPTGWNPPQVGASNFDWVVGMHEHADGTRALSLTVGGVFSGVISQLKIHRGVFTSLDAIAPEEEPVSSTAAVPQLPVAFSLTNEDGSPSLYIDNHPSGHTMRLFIGNLHRAPLLPAALPGMASPESHHFHLSFRPGTLKSFDDIAVSTNGWSLAKRAATPQDPVDSLFLQAPNRAQLPLEVMLRRFVADPLQGTRSSRVELQCRHLLNEAGVEMVLPARRQHLNLINHQGRRDVPVHVGFVESNRVTIEHNKELRLRITNVLPELTSGDLGNRISFDKSSRLKITVDERAGTAWALARPQTVRQIGVRHAKGAVDRNRPAQQAQRSDYSESSVWELRPGETFLAPGEDLEVLLDNVRAEGSAGHSNIYVELINVPGYWDNRFTLPIEKVAPPAWTPLPLRMHWRALDVAPACYRDPNGIVHLRGSCILELETGLGYFYSHQVPFVLPDGCTPALAFTKYGHCEFTNQTSEQRLVRIEGKELTPQLKPLAGIEIIKYSLSMRVYLDGISFFGGV